MRTTSAETRPGLPPAPLAPVARLATADVWLDLIAQRPSAVVTVGGRVIVDLGRPEARIHTQLKSASSWLLAREVDGVRAGLVRGRGGALELPYDGPLAPKIHATGPASDDDPDADDAPSKDSAAPAKPTPEEASSGLAMALTVRALMPDQVMTVLWDERPLANLTLTEDWARRTFSLPPDAVRAGDNRVRLHFRRTIERDGEDVAAAIQTIELGTLKAIREGPPARMRDAYYVEQAPASASGELVLPPEHGLAYYVAPPRRGRLRIEARGRGRIQVLASTDEDHRRGQKPAILLDEALRETGHEAELDLSGYGGLPVRLEVRVQGGQGVRISALQLLAPRALPVDRRTRTARDVYILGVEGARADTLFEVAKTGGFPAIERLFREALVFERAYAVAPWAIPNHAAWLSSVAPATHRTVRGTFVAPSSVLLPELLDRAGYETLAVTANADFNAERGLDQGFDRLVLRDRSHAEAHHASAVMASAIEQAGIGADPLGKPRDPRFVYVDVADPQAPYDPPRELFAGVERPEGAPLPHLTHIWVGKVRIGKLDPTSAELDYVRALYRGELLVVDRALDRLFNALQEEGSLDDAIIVLVGLHGEEFYEHSGAGHGFTLFEESMHVPLAIRAPTLLAPGRVKVPVDIIDLAPTVVDLLGLDPPVEWQGESLVPVIDDPQPPPRMVMAYTGDGSRAAIIGQHKLVSGVLAGRAGEALYDIQGNDRLLKGEAEAGIALRMLRSAMHWEGSVDDGWKRGRWGSGVNLRPSFARDFGM